MSPTSRIAIVLLAVAAHSAAAQTDTTKKPRPEDTEVWKPVPKIVAPGRTDRDAPADAVILFGGTDLEQWVKASDGSPAKWNVAGGIMTVHKAAGDIKTKRLFTNFQLHLEWQIPLNVTGKDQERGNSGVFLAYDPKGFYELQILDSYQNTTYVNGQAGSIYKQHIPLVNAMRKPGEWQTYEVVWTAPVFNTDGSVKAPAYVTAFHNGLLIQDHVALRGVTKYIGVPEYTKHGPAPIMLQAHGDPSPPISFRNIWLRELP